MIPLDDAPAAGGRRAVVREREEAVIASLRSLGTALDGEPDPAFRAATRARLVAMAAVRTPAPAPAPRSLLSRLTGLRPDASAPAWSPVRRRLTAGLAGGALAVTALASLVAVATGASPGDPLYDLKRGTEQTQLALSGSDRGLTLLGFAHTRLTELAALGGSGDAALAVRTLRDMDDETTKGAAALTEDAVQSHDPATARQLASWGADQSALLTGLRPQVPAGAQPAADQTAALIARVTERGTALATSLECATGPAVGGTDPLGPVPLPCATTSTNAPVQVGGTTGGTTAPVPLPGSTATPAIPTPGGGGTVSAPTGGTTTGGTTTGGTTTGGTTTGGTTTGGTTTGGTTTGGTTTGGTTGGAGSGVVVPTVPGLPTTGLPSTTVPRTGTSTAPVPPTSTGPLLPTSPVPGSPLPPGTTSTTGSGSPGSGSDTSGLPGVSLCVPPLTIGSC